MDDQKDMKALCELVGHSWLKHGDLPVRTCGVCFKIQVHFNGRWIDTHPVRESDRKQTRSKAS